VLVVEDEDDIATLMTHALEREGDIETRVAKSGDAGLSTAIEWPADLVILDLSLPGLAGLEVCRILKARPETSEIAIIMVTARGTETDRVVGLNLGADDYIAKPFGLRELVARIRAVLRRKLTESTSSERQALVYRNAHLVADFDAVSVKVDDVEVHLTRREFELLRCLIQNRNRVLSRDRLLERVWGYDGSVETRSVDVHVARLRAKLGPVGQSIETVIGLGYRFAG
jgi:DNA-binding response OmpR family regulator